MLRLIDSSTAHLLDAMADMDSGQSELQILSSKAPFVSAHLDGVNEKMIRGWPRGPQKLRRNACKDKITTFFDVLLILCPLLFIVIGILAVRLDGNEISEYGGRITQATKLGPTIFPIIFAAIVGNLMKNYALWRAEHGAPLGLLEQLNGSTSFASTISNAFQFYHVPHIGLVIVILWAISPVGGQGVLRILSTAPSDLFSTKRAFYLNPNTDSWFEAASGLRTGLTAINSIYTASILATDNVRNSPRDMWDNPKVPVLDLNDANQSSNPWRHVDHSKATSYSSLVGLVLMGIPSEQNCEFSAESSYFDLDCKLIGHHMSDDDIYATMGTPLYHNVTNLFYGQAQFAVGRLAARTSFFIDTSYNFSDADRTSSHSHANMWYGSRDTSVEDNGSLSSATLFNCTISTIRVESRVTCQKGSCAVDRMRRSEHDTRPDYVTPWHGDWVALYNLVSQFPYAAGIVREIAASPTDNYIHGDASLFSQQSDDMHDWTNISAADVSSRLTTLFNTYWQATLSPHTIASALILSPTPNDTQALPAVHGDGVNFNETTASLSRTVTIYTANKAWAAIFIIASIILQLCAFASLTLRFMITVPDILGQVSTMTRDNPYVPLPEGGSALGGSDRARILQDLRVQIVDVNCEDELGHIAFAAVNEGMSGCKRVRKGRLYL